MVGVAIGLAVGYHGAACRPVLPEVGFQFRHRKGRLPLCSQPFQQRKALFKGFFSRRFAVGRRKKCLKNRSFFHTLCLGSRQMQPGIAVADGLVNIPRPGGGLLQLPVQKGLCPRQIGQQMSRPKGALVHQLDGVLGGHLGIACEMRKQNLSHAFS